MEKITIEKYSDTEVKQIKTTETIIPATDFQVQLDSKQKEIDQENQTLADEIAKTTARQAEINNLITSLTSDLAEINANIAKATAVGVTVDGTPDVISP